MKHSIDRAIRELGTELQCSLHVPRTEIRSGFDIQKIIDLAREKAFEKFNCGLIVSTTRTSNPFYAISLKITRVE